MVEGSSLQNSLIASIDDNMWDYSKAKKKHAKERTLEKKMKQLMKDYDHMKLILQHIYVNILISDPSNPTLSGHHAENHIRGDNV